MSYDKIITKCIDGEEISYGIVFGNESVVFIKTGADGSIYGYKDKYPRMARRIHERMGATVICSSNPYIENELHVAADKELIESIVTEMNCLSYEVSFFGTSDGAYHNLFLAKAIPETVKIVCVNTSTYSFDVLRELLCELSDVSKVLVYGNKDNEYDYAPVLKKQNIDNLEVITVAGADHEFNRMLEEYILLSDLL